MAGRSCRAPARSRRRKGRCLRSTFPCPNSLTKALEAPKCLDLSLPKANFPELRLPTGGTIKGIADITKGIPSDCSMNISLALQVAPIMASMECLLKVLKFLGVLIGVFKDLSSGNVAGIPSGLGKIAEAGGDVAECIGMVISPAIPFGQFIKDLILMIVKMLKCLLGSLKSVVEVLDGLELEISSAAQNGNDALAAQLQCAKENAMTAADGAMQAIDPIATILCAGRAVLRAHAGRADDPASAARLGWFHRQPEKGDHEPRGDRPRARGHRGEHPAMSAPFASPQSQPRAFLGKGLAFPLTVTPQGRLASASGEAKVEQSIWLILSTALGERVMRPDLGCAAHNELFGPASSATIVRIVDQVRRCLTEQEPRIAVLEVTAELSASDQNVLLIRIDYQLRNNNAMTNLVYPFFIREGV